VIEDQICEKEPSYFKFPRQSNLSRKLNIIENLQSFDGLNLFCFLPNIILRITALFLFGEALHSAL
jgi:hypothetical protein